MSPSADESTAPQPASKPASKPWVRATVDYAGPLAFLVALIVTRNIITATWALVPVSALALAFGFVMERRIAPLPLLAGGAALIFGGLTLVFHNPIFVKIKPTVINALLGVCLIGGYFLGKSPLKLLMGDMLQLSEPTWRKLTVRYGLFFFVMAGLNELVRNTQTDLTWGFWRMPGMAILTVLFAFTQLPLMLKDASALEIAARSAETQD